MKTLQRSLMSFFTLGGALLLSGCSPTATSSPSTTPQPRQSQAPSNSGTHGGGQVSAGAVQNMRQATVALPAGRALRLRYDVRPRGVVYQYFVKHHDLLYVLTYTTSTAAAPRYAKIFDLSAHTFQLR